MQIGIYYGQYTNQARNEIEEEGRFDEMGDYSRFIDMHIFDPEDCVDILHCTVSGDEQNYIQFMLSKSEFVALNLIPIEEDDPMIATLSYRLINKDEYKFIIQTLLFMAAGFLLIFIFIGLLFKALNPSNSENRQIGRA